MLPVEDRGFLQICGDGAMQLLRFDANGEETQRVRSKTFFDIQLDPVFDKPVPMGERWLLTSYGGQVFEVSVNGRKIDISKPWSMVSEAELAAGWRPGGGQHVAYHPGLDLLFVLMNPGGEFSHDSAGTEIWVFDRGAQRRVHRTPIEYKGTDLWVSQTENPLLTVTGEDMLLHVLDVATMVEIRSITGAGNFPGHLQAF